MAKLNKSIEDYSRINILLRRVGDTPNSTTSHFQTILNQAFSAFAPQQQTITEISQNLPPNSINSTLPLGSAYPLVFRCKDFDNDWPEFECIYKCHFMMGVYDGEQNDNTRIKDSIARLHKQALDERRKLVGLLLINTKKEACYELKIEPYFMFVPNLATDADVAGFLQPAMHKLISECLSFLVSQVRKLKSDDNDYIVFNKNEERPQAKSLKKKKKGRCLKLAGDFCLMLQVQEDAFTLYKEAADLLKKNDDYHWLMGLQQGKAAAYYNKINRIQTEEDSQKLVKNIQVQMNLAIEASKKAKMNIFQAECYFRFFKSLCRLKQPQMLDFYVSEFIQLNLKANYVIDDQAIFYAEIATLYKQLGMHRKHNYFLALAADLFSLTKPSISKLFYSEILKCQKLAQWTYLYSLTLKTVIRTDKAYELGGQAHVELLDSCGSKLNLAETNEIIQTLNFVQAPAIQKFLKFITLTRFSLSQSATKPKENRLVNYSRQRGVTAPWKRLSQLKYQINQPLEICLSFTNSLPIAIHANYRLIVEKVAEQSQQQPGVIKDPFQFSVYLEPKCANSIQETAVFTTQKGYQNGNYRITGLEMRVWNFFYVLPVPKQISLEIYEPNAQVDILVPETVEVEKSSNFQFSFSLVNRNQHRSHKLKLNISIYYAIETGLQENVKIFEHEELQKFETLQLNCIESLNKKPEFKFRSDSILEVVLEQFKAPRHLLKKIQISIDYVQGPNSKYQISRSSTVQIAFRESVAASITALLHPRQHLVEALEANQLEGSEVANQNYISQNCVVKVEFAKIPNDLKAYQIRVFGLKQQATIDEFILSQQLKIQKHYNFQKQAIAKVEELDSLLQVSWECLTDNTVKGEFLATRGQGATINLSQSHYIAKMTISSDGEIDDSQVIRVKRGLVLKIDYSIQHKSKQPGIDFWHQIRFQSIGIKQKPSAGCVIQGKTLVRSGDSPSAENSIEIEFQSNFANSYAVIVNIWEQGCKQPETYLHFQTIQCQQ